MVKPWGFCQLSKQWNHLSMDATSQLNMFGLPHCVPRAFWGGIHVEHIVPCQTPPCLPGRMQWKPPHVHNFCLHMFIPYHFVTSCATLFCLLIHTACSCLTLWGNWQTFVCLHTFMYTVRHVLSVRELGMFLQFMWVILEHCVVSAAATLYTCLSYFGSGLVRACTYMCASYLSIAPASYWRRLHTIPSLAIFKSLPAANKELCLHVLYSIMVHVLVIFMKWQSDLAFVMFTVWP